MIEVTGETQIIIVVDKVNQNAVSWCTGGHNLEL
jgi:hypothetical protein